MCDDMKNDLLTRDERMEIWDAAIGLQQVDSLEISDFMKGMVELHCNGEASFYEVENVMFAHHAPNRTDAVERRTIEADVASTRIAEFFSGYIDNWEDFELSYDYYCLIHKELFTGLYQHAGKVRTYNIEKCEDVLNDKSVEYGSANYIKETLIYDLKREEEFSFEGLSLHDVIEHISKFIARLWQIHPFSEGNTRTTAVFLVQYLKTLGYNVNYKVFAENSVYFRNALVRANYDDIKNGIYETVEYLEMYISNLIGETDYKLCNEELYI